MSTILFDEWRNYTSHVKYPLADVATLTNSAGDVVPDDLFLDMQIFAQDYTGQYPAYVSQITVDSSYITITISSGGVELCRAATSRTSPTPTLSFVDDYGRPAGMAICSTVALQTVAGWQLVDHEFSEDEMPLAPDVVIPIPADEVTGFLLDDGEVFYGPVTFYGESGVTFEAVTTAEGETEILVHAIGDPLFRRKACESEDGTINAGPFLKTITCIGGGVTTVVEPNTLGHVTITAGDEFSEDTVIRVIPTDSELQVKLVATRTTTT